MVDIVEPITLYILYMYLNIFMFDIYHSNEPRFDMIAGLRIKYAVMPSNWVISAPTMMNSNHSNKCYVMLYIDHLICRANKPQLSMCDILWIFSVRPT